jgi:hypothetical protein
MPSEIPCVVRMLFGAPELPALSGLGVSTRGSCQEHPRSERYQQE